MPQNKSLREEQSRLETNLKMSRIPATQIRRDTEYLLASKPTRRNEPQEAPLSYESLSRDYPADKVERYFS
jgi:hypothetical protein